jgi:hypothetical protein
MNPDAGVDSSSSGTEQLPADWEWERFLVVATRNVLSGGAPPAYTAAKYAGKGTLENVFCAGGNGFPDLLGNCWKCTDGYSHDNILLLPTDGRVCKKPGSRQTAKPNDWDCLKVGGWHNFGNPTKCYRCPDGYNHDASKTSSQDGVCYRDSGESFSAANRMEGSVLCKSGFFDPVDGGTCWKCPGEAPNRNLKKGIKTAQACMSTACGAGGQRPCQVHERIPSCNNGLTEDVLRDLCAPPLSARTLCKAAVESVTQKIASPEIQVVTKLIGEQLSAASKAVDSVTKQAVVEAGKLSREGNLKKYADEALRLKNNLNVESIKKLFTVETVCHGDMSNIAQALTDMGLKPSASVMSLNEPRNHKRRRQYAWEPRILARTFGPCGSGRALDEDRHFYLEVGFSVTAAVGLAATEGLSFVTDFRGNIATLWSYGVGLSTNVKVDALAFFTFYPKISLAEFGKDISDYSAWDWELAFGGGYGGGGGLFVLYDETMGVHPPESYGPGAHAAGFTIGVSADILPVDGSLVPGYAYMISSMP